MSVRYVVGLSVCVAILLAGTFITIAGKLEHRITVLEHACVPVNTGGGVTQCAQPPRGFERKP